MVRGSRGGLAIVMERRRRYGGEARWWWVAVRGCHSYEGVVGIGRSIGYWGLLTTVRVGACDMAVGFCVAVRILEIPRQLARFVFAEPSERSRSLEAHIVVPYAALIAIQQPMRFGLVALLILAVGRAAVLIFG